MGVVHSAQFKGLEESFQSFNQLSETLEFTYHRLEDRVQELHEQLADVEQKRRKEKDDHNRKSQRYNSVLNVLPAGVVTLNEHGRVQEHNPAASDLLGEPLQDELWLDVVTRAFAPCADNGPDISLRDGRILSLSTCPLGDAPGQVLLLNDVTETRQLQNRLNQHQRLSAMGEMAAGIAHQIRTPLAAGLLCSSQLKNQKIDNAKRSELLDKVVRHMRHLEGLINDMLLFSKSGHAGTDTISIADLLRNAGEEIRQQCLDENISLTIITGNNTDMVVGNQRMLHSALDNLLVNAVQVMTKNQNNGQLTLQLQTQSPDSIDISICDTGSGISPDIQDKIFQPFFTTRSRGTGLGLSVVHAIIRAHQGDIWLEKSSDRGTTFTIRLPVISEYSQGEAARQIPVTVAD